MSTHWRPPVQFKDSLIPLVTQRPTHMTLSVGGKGSWGKGCIKCLPWKSRNLNSISNPTYKMSGCSFGLTFGCLLAAILQILASASPVRNSIPKSKVDCSWGTAAEVGLPTYGAVHTPWLSLDSPQVYLDMWMQPLRLRSVPWFGRNLDLTSQEETPHSGQLSLYTSHFSSCPCWAMPVGEEAPLALSRVTLLPTLSCS